MNKGVISFAVAAFAAIVHAAPELGATFFGGAALERGKPLFEAKTGNQASTNGDSTVIPVEAETERINWWRKRHDEKLAEIRRSGGAFDVVLIGDSITHFAESKPERGGEAYAAFTNAYKVLNLGYGGDRTQNVCWRILNNELSGYRAKAFVLMIGTNNNGWGGNEPDDTALGIKRIVGMIRERQPQAKILLLPVFPRAKPDGIYAHDPADAKNRITNNLIRKTADGDNIFWLDFNDKFIGEDGRISKNIMGDYLHPTAEGYKIMFGEISAALGKILAK